MTTNVETSQGLIHAYILDSNGGGQSLSWEQIRAWEPSHGLLWVHLKYADEQVQDWIKHNCGLESLVSDALLAEETRPRATSIGDGLLIALRGINTNPGATPDDMVSTRLWADSKRILSTCGRDIRSFDDIVEHITEDRGPVDAGDFIVTLTNRIVWRMTDSVDQLEDQMAELEDNVLSGTSISLRFDLATLRRKTISFRRYLAPERDAISSLMAEKVSWMNDGPLHAPARS